MACSSAASYLSRMSWLDVAVAPSSPSAALPTAAAAPLPASMILTHRNEQPAKRVEREGRGGEGERGCEEVDQEGKTQMRQKESHVEAREMRTGRIRGDRADRRSVERRAWKKKGGGEREHNYENHEQDFTIV